MEHKTLHFREAIGSCDFFGYCNKLLFGHQNEVNDAEDDEWDD